MSGFNRIAQIAVLPVLMGTALVGVRLFAMAEATLATSIPLGTIAQLFQPAPFDATAIWTGAEAVARAEQGSTAVCPLLQPGITMVQV